MISEDSEDLFYKRLTQLRNQKNVSARDMSLSLGQSENYINNIENRKNFPSMAGFFYICEYFGIHPKEFFDDTIENPFETSKLISNIKKLDGEKTKHIAAVIEDLLEK
ncbi:helix-turn-helix domain-containing protein [Anaerotignum faecicola]|nr:helix-turn-helix domain-containing protein [Anaerotignum faecicola]